MIQLTDSRKCGLVDGLKEMWSSGRIKGNVVYLKDLRNLLSISRTDLRKCGLIDELNEMWSC